MGVGGSIPFIAAFQEAFPDAAVLVTGVEDPDTRAHGANEGLHLRRVRAGSASPRRSCCATWRGFVAAFDRPPVDSRGVPRPHASW